MGRLSGISELRADTGEVCQRLWSTLITVWAGWGSDSTDALEISLLWINSCHASEPYPIHCWCASPNYLGHSGPHFVVKEAGHKERVVLLDSTEDSGGSHLLYEAAVGSTILRKRCSTFLCKLSGFWSYTQPEGPIFLGARAYFIFLGARAYFRPLSSSS